MRLISITIICIAIVLIALNVLPSAGAQESLPAPAAIESGKSIRCSGKVFTQKDFRKYVHRVYLRKNVKVVALKRLDKMRSCAKNIRANKLMLRMQKHEGKVRKNRNRKFLVRPHLLKISQCESHGDPKAISPDGQYRGKYQFSFSTWQSVGGKGDPAAASEYEQDMRADILYRTGGPGHWPVCQYK